jgi:hypothetical protein
VQYGDVTVTISNNTDIQDAIPDRYSSSSDDKLMNMLISKGYAFSKSAAAGMHVEVNCGCNCNCCMKPTNTTKDDFWELSKDCGCDCGCCNMNAYKVKQNPQYWINKVGALAATREIVKKNLNLEGEKLEEYLNINFGNAWADYDVLGNDMVEVEQMSSFMKRVLKDQTAQL